MLNFELALLVFVPIAISSGLLWKGDHQPSALPEDDLFSQKLLFIVFYLPLSELSILPQGSENRLI